MADGGWIKVYRKIRQSFVWTDANQLKLWLLILMKASHDGNRFLFNGQQVDVSSGQFVTGRDAIASEFNAGAKPVQRVSGRQLWRWIKLFEKEQMLSIKSNTKYSVITVISWGEYQEDDQRLSITSPSSVHQVSTIKNAKNAKNANKRDSQHPRKREYADDSPELIEATYLWKKIKSNNPEHRKPNLQPWANDIRKMHEIDKRPFDKIHRMIDWCQSDTFWQTNILSAAKLREKYDTMKAQANRPYASERSYKAVRREAHPEWLDQTMPMAGDELTEEEDKELADRLAKLKEVNNAGG
ncbi:replication protein [Lacticaseibacillus mingshuiensis]|uniref:Replication protein n=1 Tax=Lacticaseibacillus mingshuiensis TaxID=2799574 RepID=A0ABW4CIJ9_9LACO|nr:replication protein [Lacticaseibacillus mingshuiensis]